MDQRETHCNDTVWEETKERETESDRVEERVKEGKKKGGDPWLLSKAGILRKP